MDPVLAVTTIPAGTDGERVARTFKVEGGIHYIKGNHAPYFSLTYWAHRKGFPNQCESGGAGHEEILRYYPKFADLAALHLAYIDGTPMHAIANGWYQLAGALGGAGEQYHAGNSKGHHSGEYRTPTPDECLQRFCDSWRISIEEGEKIRDAAKQAQDAVAIAPAMPANGYPSLAHYERAMREHVETARQAKHDDAIAVVTKYANAMKPRWKAQADACIEHHGLVVYGDRWPTPEAQS